VLFITDYKASRTLENKAIRNLFTGYINKAGRVKTIFLDESCLKGENKNEIS